MLSRREVLTVLTSTPLVSLDRESGTQRNVRLIEETHTLAAESCAGFRRLMKQTPLRAARDIIVLPAARDLHESQFREIVGQVKSGACLIVESGACFSSPHEERRAAAMLQDAFSLRIIPPVSAAESYINYSWPIEKRVRNFEAVTPVLCPEREVIARWQHLPVGCRKQIGSGVVIYLGSMLGPGLFAEEREAHAVGASLISQVPMLPSIALHAFRWLDV